ncbi:hypothetical protein OPV22_015688 [Ensete ventricosum]|uniref:Pentacotripeptide-repeat region of PRORP domain-containing protein n=1 Tax=Ensete ventricosum TaxID=4639 RepID=A0AAV8RAZ4_ENSVE|nr:hypothetical protein OPV22_015688 [Ensete ventricosum]
MQLSSVKPNRVSLSSALLACGRLGARRGGGCFHCLAIKTRFEHDVLVANAVVDMYAKCGSLELASLMFDHFDGKDVVNMYEAILGRAGKLQEAEEFIKQMPMEPEASIWVSLLRACRIHGDLDLGEKNCRQAHQHIPHPCWNILFSSPMSMLPNQGEQMWGE